MYVRSLLRPLNLGDSEKGAERGIISGMNYRSSASYLIIIYVEYQQLQATFQIGAIKHSRIMNKEEDSQRHSPIIFLDIDGVGK